MKKEDAKLTILTQTDFNGENQVFAVDIQWYFFHEIAKW